jgi:hypothetical protein
MPAFTGAKGPARTASPPITAACEPCPGIQGGKSTCDGNHCGAECPAGQKPCDDKCIPMDQPCGGCPTGKNECNGLCVAATSKTACGSACTVCPTSANGMTDCDGTQCTLTCNAGFHRCGDECKADDSTASCGISCTPCTPAQGGGVECKAGMCQATCPSGTTLCRSSGACLPTGQACDGMCPAGKHECSGNCLPDTDVNSCGTGCTACPSPANADATCEDSSCGFKCRAGYHVCGKDCKRDDSPASCGTACTACPAVSNGTPSCSGGACGSKCSEGFYLCNGTCQSCCNDGQCGSGKVCSGNKCVTACVANQSCTQGIGPCRAGRTFCASPASQPECRDAGPDDGRNTCGSGKVVFERILRRELRGQSALHARDQRLPSGSNLLRDGDEPTQVSRRWR